MSKERQAREQLFREDLGMIKTPGKKNSKQSSTQRLHLLPEPDNEQRTPCQRATVKRKAGTEKEKPGENRKQSSTQRLPSSCGTR